jgi:hypothetical protein
LIVGNLANGSRGEIDFPQAGEGAVLRFTVDSLERLESKYGAEYLDIVLLGLHRAQVGVFKAVFDVALQNGASEFPFESALEALQRPIIDALYLTVYGRTYDEQEAHLDKEYAKQMKAAEKNPRLAAALFSRQLGESVTDPVSDQTRSAASPQ